MQVSAGRCQLGQAALDRRVDVLICVSELECAGVQLTLDLPKPALDGGQPRLRQQAGTRERACMREAARDVDRVELEVGFQRRRETLQLWEQTPLEAAAPQIASLFRYGASLFTSPSRPFSSRSCKRPCTWAAVRTPIPQSLMKPAAADWSKASPLP